MKDWAVAFISAALLVCTIVWGFYIIVWGWTW